MANAPKPRVFILHHKEQQFHKIMSEGYPNGPHLNKKTICPYRKKFMDVRRIRFQKTLSSQSYMVDILMFSLNISAKPTFILRKSKGNSYCQTRMIFRTGKHSKLVRATFLLYMITKRLPSYNCCKIIISNFNSFVLSCT